MYIFRNKCCPQLYLYQSIYGDVTEKSKLTPIAYTGTCVYIYTENTPIFTHAE